jgi:hypothetical protein
MMIIGGWISSAGTNYGGGCRLGGKEVLVICPAIGAEKTCPGKDVMLLRICCSTQTKKCWEAHRSFV